MRCQAERDPQGTLDELSGLIYAAAVSPHRWTDFLDRLATRCGNINTHLFGQDHATGHHLGILFAGYDPGYIRSFEEHYGTINSWAPGMLPPENSVNEHF